MAGFSKAAANFYDSVLYLPDYLFLKKKRQRLITQLSGKILEVGCGTGLNFKHYSNTVEVVGIEPAAYMLKKAEKRVQRLPSPHRFTLHLLGCGDPETEKLFQPESLDAVVCTLVLCTIPDPERAIYNFTTWLKPGGKLLVLEHIRSHKPNGARLQNLFTPAWKNMAGGCHLNRPTDILLKKSGLKLVREKHFWLGMPFYEAEFEKQT